MGRFGRLKVILALVLVAVCAVLAFRDRDGEGGLFLYCGAGIRPAVEQITREFTAQTGVAVQTTYSGSGCLLSMLTFARSGDLYMPGEKYYTDQARSEGHVAGDDAIAAYFVAVVCVQPDNPKNIRSLRDLAREDVRVGIGEPESVACGLTARRILEKAGVWDEVKRNVDMQGANTATAVELTNAMQLNALDAVITWDAMAYAVRDKLKILVIPVEQNILVEIPLAKLAWSTHSKAATQFVEYVTSDAGRKAFEAHGYHTSPTPYMLPYYGELLAE